MGGEGDLLKGNGNTGQPGGQDSGASQPKGRSRRKIGAQYESKVRALLLDWGYSVHRSHMSVVHRGGFIFSNSNDIFNAIDIVALKPGERTHWIQVTGDTGMKRKLDKLAPVKWNFQHSWVEIWKATGGGRFVIMLYDGRELKRVGELVRNRLMLDAALQFDVPFYFQAGVQGADSQGGQDG